MVLVRAKSGHAAVPHAAQKRLNRSKGGSCMAVKFKLPEQEAKDLPDLEAIDKAEDEEEFRAATSLTLSDFSRFSAFTARQGFDG